MGKLLMIFVLTLSISCNHNEDYISKPRILISSDIGGTDPDDNQSMIHFLMYSDLFKTEGLISSPSYGQGSKSEILKMIDLYEKDLPKLLAYSKDFPSPDYLRSITKQGRKGAAPYEGIQSATEGSNWIVHCAKKKSKQPLWILVWGGLDDLAQALHDAPEIQDKIKVYWIGGPNKKWSTNSYSYIAENFPDLWFIEANAVYRGFFSNTLSPENIKNENYYDLYIREESSLGKAFKNYYDGKIKMGDTPSLLYLINGDPNDPTTESWGGQFEKMNKSPRYLYDATTTEKDSVAVYSIIEYHIQGPEINIPSDSVCFRFEVSGQVWNGHYQGNGQYVMRYAPKKQELLTFKIISEIPELNALNNQLVVINEWPGNTNKNAFKLGNNWHTDPSDRNLYIDGWQGAKSVQKWREDVLLDWAARWELLNEK